MELAKAKVQAGDPGARDDLERAIEVARDARARATARISLSVVLVAAGEAARSIEVLDQGLDQVAAEDPELADRMEAHLLSTIEVAGRAWPSSRGPSGSESPGCARRASRGPLSLAVWCCALSPTRRWWGEGRPPKW